MMAPTKIPSERANRIRGFHHVTPKVPQTFLSQPPGEAEIIDTLQSVKKAREKMDGYGARSILHRLINTCFSPVMTDL